MTTVIPELTSNQMACISEMMKTGSALSMLPDASKDNPEQFKRFTETREDLAVLLKLGFILDNTEFYRIQLQNIKANTGRDLEVFELSTIGRALFAAYTSPHIN
jgi:hypothetical protein